MSQYRFITILSLTAWLLGCAPGSTGWKPEEQQRQKQQSALSKQSQEVAQAISAFKSQAPGLKAYFDKAYGYAVFPNVGKGAFGIGGAYGQGQVFEQRKLVGKTSLTQFTIGLQAGGQSYQQIIFFKNKAILDDFKKGNFEFDAQSSAVAATLGAAANVAYSNDVAVFSLVKGGLMFEAALGGQKFAYQPLR